MIRRLENLSVDAVVKEDDVDTLKTAIVVILLLAVLYGVYVTLNQPEQEIPEDIAWAQQQATAPLNVDFGPAVEDGTGVSVTVADTAPWSSDAAPDAAAATSAATSDGGALALATTPASLPASGPPAGAPSPSSVPPGDLPPSGLPAAASDHGTAAITPGSVAAPELITPESASPADAESGGAYALQTPSQAMPAGSSPESAQGSDSDLSSQFVPSSPADPVANGGNVAAAGRGSIYAPENSGPPTTNYGETAEPGPGTVPSSADAPVAASFESKAAAPANQPAADYTNVDSIIQAARGQIDQGQYYEALLKLSFTYNAPGMSAEDNAKLRRWLDPLAAKVIYSQEHLIGAPYQLQANETLQTVAAKHNVPWQLLANINGIRDPAGAAPGTTIKVVPGPFHAEIDSANSTLTLFAGRLYAGQFAVTVNPANAPRPGEYQVNDKQPGHTFYAGNAQTLAPQDPQNPFGGVWIDLGNDIAIHSTASAPGQTERHGCISMAAKDANDLYGILSVGSNVIVR